MVDVSDFILVYILAYFPIDAHQVIWTFGIYLAFERHICSWHIFDRSMINKCCSILIFDGYVQ